MDRERFDDLKEPYVLKALPENEREEMEEYLVAHPELQSEIDELGTVASLLALAPPEQEPSPRLRKNLMNSVRAESSSPGRAAVPFSTRIAEFFSARRLALGAATLVVLAALVTWNVSLQNQNGDLQGKVQSLQSQSQQQKQTQSTYALEGSGTAQNVSGEVVKLKEHTVLMADHVPSVPKGKTYQIWVIKNGVPKPAGVFDPHNGKATGMITVSLKGADTVAVTIEPSGGSPKPTSDPIISSKV